MKMDKYVVETTNKLIREYPGEIIIGILMFGVMAYDNPANLDTDNLYQSVNYLKDSITHINSY